MGWNGVEGLRPWTPTDDSNIQRRHGGPPAPVTVHLGRNSVTTSEENCDTEVGVSI